MSDMAQMLRSGAGPTGQPIDPQRMMAAQWDMIARKRQAGVPLTPEEEQAVAEGEAYKSQIGEPMARGTAMSAATPLTLMLAQANMPTPAEGGDVSQAQPASQDELMQDANAGIEQRAAKPSLSELIRQAMVGDAQAQTRPKTVAPDAANDPVRAMQQDLKVKGYYNGPIDGSMGPATQAAKAAFERDTQAKQSQAIELGRAGADAEKAKAAAAETERLRVASEQDVQRKQQGDTRMREMESKVSPLSQALREYGPALGAVAGGLGGMLARRGVVKASDAVSAAKAQRADALMSAPAAGTADRVGRVNQFWAEGQAPGVMGSAPGVPFAAVPKTKTGFAPNPDAPSASSLYQPNRLNNAATDVAVPMTGLAESAISEKFIGERARNELSAAQEAVQADPSEANILRLQSAKDKVAVADAMSNAGRGMAAGYVGDMALKRRVGARPNTAAAESEQISLGRLLRGGNGSGGNGGGSQAKAATSYAPKDLTKDTHGWRAPDGRFSAPPE